jgi:hypothetical protein
MSDRTNTLTVVLEHQMRTDDAEQIIEAIRMVKGVLNVEANVSDSMEYMATEQAKHDLRKKIFEVLR